MSVKAKSVKQVKASKISKSAADFKAAIKEQNKGKKAVKLAPAVYTATIAKSEEKAPKAKKEAIVSGGKILINEAVGVHFRADAGTAPETGDMLMLSIGKVEVPLIISCTTPLKDESILIQAWVTKGSGDYKVLGDAKGQMATVIWK